jgi:predicted nucleic acid-binding protein
MVQQPTLFNGNKVVVDAMVIINYHGLLALDKLINWTSGELVVIDKVLREALYSRAGTIDLAPYIRNYSISIDAIIGQKQEEMFYAYCNSTLDGKTIHNGEAACLTLAISKGYGLACDEKCVRNEFSKRCPGKICIHSWGIVDRAVKLGFISSDDGQDLKRGFYYV